jgi:hypothetical protein
MVAVQGKVQSGFEGVSEAFAANFANDFEVGASVAVVHKGELVVDIWGGLPVSNGLLRGRATPLSMCGPQRRP